MGFESSTDGAKNSASHEANYEISVLASTLAHEIRNPLQAMRLQLDAASRDQANPESVKSLSANLDRIERVVRRVESLAHRYSLNLEKVNLVEVRDSVLSAIRFWLEAAGIELVETTEWEGAPYCEGDRELLEQVILNILMNAIQAMPEGGKLRFNLIECQDEAQIEIIDTGIGMDADTLKKVGTPFFTTKKTGSGLGLSFCKSIISMHQGQLDFESKLGDGSTVRIRLPKRIQFEKEERHS